MLTYIRPPGYAITRSAPSEFTVTYRGERIGRTVTRAAAGIIRARHARRNVVDGWMVRRVTGASHTGACRRGPHPVRGTHAVTVTDCMSDNDMIKLVNVLAAWHGQPENVKPSPVGTVGYRWTWEWFAPDGHRVTEMVIATPVR
jgi:hypothetical protein